MSDDDFDIFSAVCKRAPRNALPSIAYDNPCNDSFSKEYDFIETSSAKKTSRSKGSKSKKIEKDALAPAEPPEPAEEQKAPAQPLSPVSQLILNLTPAITDVAPLIPDEAPVARRTRNSLGKQKTHPAPEQTVVPDVQPKKRNTRARKNAAAAAGSSLGNATAAAGSSVGAITTASLVSSLDNLGASFTNAPRRTQVSEMAARSQVLDSIDLVSAVVPRVEGFVNLDSDDESPAPDAAVEVTSVFDTDNPTIEVALTVLGEVQYYKLRQHQKFKHMFKEVAERNGVDEGHVSVDMYYKFIGPDDTPHSIDLKSFHTLSGHITKSANKASSKGESHQEDLSKKPRKFQLKVQAAKWKQPLVVALKKKDPFKILYIKCAEELNVEARLIKLFFDGDLLDPEDTPKNQDMEGNEMIDLEMKT